MTYTVISAGEKKKWTEKLQVVNVKFTVKLDTWAKCNILPKYLMRKTKANLESSRTKYLISYKDNKIAVLGGVEHAR